MQVSELGQLRQATTGSDGPIAMEDAIDAITNRNGRN
jgi:hypothetical protein